jgi:glutathione S-transferase
MPHPATHVPHRVYGAAASGNCHKVKLALDLLRIPYRWHETDLMQGETRTAEFLRINPNGKLPVLQIDDHTFLPESTAILCYLADGSTRTSRRSPWRASSCSSRRRRTMRACPACASAGTRRSR